ncbi:MAG: ABC transporter permease, partial [Burkholderiales bacterium]
MMVVILWTDGLVLLLLGLILAFAVFASRRPHLSLPWRRVGQSRSGMISAVILICFVSIGLLDSLHFRPQIAIDKGKPIYSVEVLSAFDALVETMRNHTERTYSSPFSAYAFSRETVVSDGVQSRIYPRLRYGGADLADPDRERIADILKRSLVAALEGVGVWALLAAILVLPLSRGKGFIETASGVLGGKAEIPWNAMLGTLLIIFLVAFPAFALSSHYHVF